MSDPIEFDEDAIAQALEASRPARLHAAHELLLARRALDCVVDGGAAFEEALRLYNAHRALAPEAFVA